MACQEIFHAFWRIPVDSADAQGADVPYVCHGLTLDLAQLSKVDNF